MSRVEIDIKVITKSFPFFSLYTNHNRSIFDTHRKQKKKSITKQPPPQPEKKKTRTHTYLYTYVHIYCIVDELHKKMRKKEHIYIYIRVINNIAFHRTSCNSIKVAFSLKNKKHQQQQQGNSDPSENTLKATPLKKKKKKKAIKLFPILDPYKTLLMKW